MLNKELLLTPQSKAPIGEFRFYTSDYAEPVYWRAYDSGGTVRTGAVLYGNEAVYSHIEIRSSHVYILSGRQLGIYNSCPICWSLYGSKSTPNAKCPAGLSVDGAFSMSSPPLGRCQSTVLDLSFLPQD